MTLRIIVDNRERNRELVDLIAKMNIEIETKQLPVGDYLISDRLCIERKTVSDFEGSIISGRLFEQVRRLTDAYSYPMIILEGERDEFRLKSAVINGAISSLYIDYGIPVLFTFDIEGTAELIKYLAKHEQEKNAREPSVKGGARSFTQNQFMEKVIGNMPGIGIETARNLLLHFGNIKEVASAQESELVKVKNVGEKRAKAIYELSTSKYIIEEKEQQLDQK